MLNLQIIGHFSLFLQRWSYHVIYIYKLIYWTLCISSKFMTEVSNYSVKNKLVIQNSYSIQCYRNTSLFVVKNNRDFLIKYLWHHLFLDSPSPKNNFKIHFVKISKETAERLAIVNDYIF